MEQSDDEGSARRGGGGGGAARREERVIKMEMLINEEIIHSFKAGDVTYWS